MQTVTILDWIINLDEMTCQNTNTDIVVGFEKIEDEFYGKIIKLPDTIYNQWANNEDAMWLLRKLIMEAEYVFIRAYTGNDLKVSKYIW